MGVRAKIGWERLRNILPVIPPILIFQFLWKGVDKVTRLSAISSQFYTSELLQWWADFRDEFSAEKPWHNIIWNNKGIRIDNKPIFYKTFLNLV